MKGSGKTRWPLTILLALWIVPTFGFILPCSAQGEESGQVDDSLPVEIQYMAFRPARWEEKALTEVVNERRNEGGLAFVYYTNTSDKPVRLRDWFMNERESGHFRLAYDIA